MSTQYRALVGLSYPINPRAARSNWAWKRVPAGTVVDDIPSKSLPWLLKAGRIEAVAADTGEVDANGEAG